MKNPHTKTQAKAQQIYKTKITKITYKNTNKTIEKNKNKKTQIKETKKQKTHTKKTKTH